MSSQQAIPHSLFGYRVIRRIGEGAGSIVYEGSHATTGQSCALKHVVVRTKRDRRFVSQLEAELEVGRQVNRRWLRRSLDLKIARSLLGRAKEGLLVMELVEGVPLDAHQDWGIETLTDVYLRTAEALMSLHSIGYVHCDMKPGNVLVGRDGQVKVIDLGQACRIGTKKERVQGTPDFISPEQVKCLPVGPRTDVFNLGAMMYALLSGRKLPTLFTVKRGENSFLLDGRIDPPHAINAEVPQNLSELVMECVRTNPAKRPDGMAELVRRLEVMHFSLGRQRAAVTDDAQTIFGTAV